MRISKFRSSILVTAVALALAVTGCRGGDGDSTAKGDIKAGAGVTSEPCPEAVNKDHGCIYLGTISDLTEGPFKALGVSITEAQKAFWKRVNQQGGIGEYDVDVTKYVKDNKYNPEVHAQVYREIKGKVLALTQTLGSPTTAAVIDDLKDSKIVAAPASWTSAWAFEDVIVESGSNYCIESMNAIDYAGEKYGTKSVLAVHYAGDYGADAAAGAQIAAEKKGMTFKHVETAAGPDNQAGAIDAVVTGKPDLVILSTGPADAAVVIGQAAARGFTGRFIGSGPTWNPGLLKSPAAPAITSLYEQAAPWQPFGSDTEGHKAMRAALGKVQANDGYTSGWVWAYPLKAALEQATQDGDLTRGGLLKAVKKLKTVDYEGMLPDSAGNFAEGGDEGQFRQTLVTKPDAAAPTGVSIAKELFEGETAKNYKLDKPCFSKLK